MVTLSLREPVKLVLKGVSSQSFQLMDAWTTNLAPVSLMLGIGRLKLNKVRAAGKVDDNVIVGVKRTKRMPNSGCIARTATL